MIYSLLAFLVFIWGEDWQSECSERTLTPMPSPHFVLTSQFNSKPTCVYVVVCFSSHSSFTWIKWWVYCYIFHWAEAGCIRWSAHQTDSPSTPRLQGRLLVLGMYAAASLAGLLSETPHLSVSQGKLPVFLPKCKMVFIFFKSSIWVESTLAYLAVSWPPNDFLWEISMPDTFHCHLWGCALSLVLVSQE